MTVPETKPLAISLMGPTASGKTGLALQLCDSFPQLDIISVDSSLVYRAMDIGSAKPDRETLERYPHHLVDIRNIDEPYSASDFYADAMKAMEQSWVAGKIPFLVGGTMLYFKVLSQGIAELPRADDAIRASIVDMAEQEGWQSIHDELREIDPDAAERIHPNDSQRLQRALEVYRLTGTPMSVLQAQSAWDSPTERPFNLVSLALMTDNRELLHQRIEQRFRQMLDQGLVEEVTALKRLYPGQANSPAMKAVGYRQVWQYLEGEFAFEEMVNKGLAATRQLAKRQITWLRSWPDLTAFDMEEEQLFQQLRMKIEQLLEIEA